MTATVLELSELTATTNTPDAQDSRLGTHSRSQRFRAVPPIRC